MNRYSLSERQQGGARLACPANACHSWTAASWAVSLIVGFLIPFGVSSRKASCQATSHRGRPGKVTHTIPRRPVLESVILLYS
jgi:hypothetical protein